MDLSELTLAKVHRHSVLKEFDCEDEDLNSFLVEKSILFHNELLATTYLLKIKDEGKLIAYFSIFNDCIKVEKSDIPANSTLRKFLSRVPHPKRSLKSFPSIKIGRLAVCKEMKNCRIGTSIIDFVIDHAVRQNEQCACKYITVDAYGASIPFYLKKNFTFLTKKDEGKETRQMQYDITPILNAIKDETEVLQPTL